jgi:hypothetical protein
MMRRRRGVVGLCKNHLTKLAMLATEQQQLNLLDQEESCSTLATLHYYYSI